MRIELSEQEREALEHLLWCVEHDLPTRLTMERMLRSVVKYRNDALYGSILSKVDWLAVRRSIQEETDEG